MASTGATRETRVTGKPRPIRDIMTSPVEAVAPDLPLVRAVQEMAQKGISSLVVVNTDGVPIGIFTERDLIKYLSEHSVLPAVSISSAMSVDPVTARPETGFFDAYNLVTDHQIRHLIVIDDARRCIGIVTDTDIVEHLDFGDFLVLSRVSEMMREDVPCVDAETSLADAACLMREHASGCVLVRMQGQMQGMVTERDMVRASGDDADTSQRRCDSIMSSPLITLSRHAAIPEAIDKMSAHHVRRLAVAGDHDEVIGIITEHDVIKVLRERYVSHLQTQIRTHTAVDETDSAQAGANLLIGDILDSAPDQAIIVTDPDRRIVFFNPLAQHLLAGGETNLGDGLLDEVARIHQVSAELLDGGYKRIVDGAHYSRIIETAGSDETRFLEVQLSGIHDDASHLVGFLLTARDITDRHRAEEELTLLQYAVDRSRQAAFLIDRNSRFQYVNEAACSALGYSREELCRMAVSDIDHLYPMDQWEKHWQEIFSKGSLAIESVHTRRNGERFPVEIDISCFNFKGRSYLFAMAEDMSEQKQVQSELTKQTVLLESLFLDTPDAIVLANDQRRIVKLNRATEKMFGYRAEQLLGESTSVLYADSADFVDQGERRYNLDAEENHAPFIVDYRRSDGEVFPGETIGAPMRSRDGEFFGFIGVVRDVSDRLRAEQALRDSEAHFRAIFEHARDAIVVIDPETQRFTQFNQQAYAELGYRREEFAALRVEDIEAQRDAEELNYCLDTVLREGSESFATKHRTKDGEIRDRLVSATRLELKEGLRIIAMWRDLTELRKARDDFERLVELSIDLICIASFEGYLLRVSNAWSRTLGWTEEELLSRPWIDFVHPEDREETQRQRQHLAGGSRVLNFENRYVCHDGQYRWLSWNARPSLEDGVIFAVARDVTDRKKMERELYQAQKMEAIGQLTGGIAHDFNNILATIMGFANLARKRHEDLPKEKLASYLDNILAAGERARDMVAQMLTFSRAQPSDNAPATDLVPLAKEVSRMLKSVLPSSIHQSLTIAESGIPVRIDPVKFHQVLMNLCVNARDAMDGEGRLEIGLRILADDELPKLLSGDGHAARWVELSVADTGCGIEEATRSRVFDPFFTTKPVGAGSGMGLSVVHGIVTSAGGVVSLDSTPGHGSRFRVLLPAADRVEVHLDEKPTTPARDGNRTSHILVIDDEPALVDYLRDLLELEGYRVSACSDSRTAWSTLQKTAAQIDLLITDQTMPDISGVELTRRMRSEQIDIPVIICTGLSVSSVQEEINGDERVRLLAKPVEPQVLLDEIAALT